MGADVNGQGTALDEALTASWDGARVGTLVGVDSVVSLKVRLAVEALLRLGQYWIALCKGGW